MISVMDSVSRRQFCGTLLATSAAAQSLNAQNRFAVLRTPTEWSFESSKQSADPFNDLDLDVVFESPSGRIFKVPAFWAGNGAWRVRFAPQETGRHRFTTLCSDTANPDLHSRRARWK